jgi:serine/threonine-protein kinase
LKDGHLVSSSDQRLSDISEATPATPATAKGLRLSPVPVERFDEYVVVARLGRGGMAEVILGLVQGPQGFRKLAAIKRLHAQYEQDPELVRMFLHEAAVAALLDHPNVVHTYKVGNESGRHFMAMEYLEGQPLHHALPRLRGPGRGLDLVLAARIAADALAGLAYVHDATSYDGTALGLVHRDVSPQNLFVTYDGQVKLVDFGIARLTAVVTAERTQPGFIKGKLGYLAPEQIDGEADRRSDLWSVGVVLWEAIAGERLFRGKTEAEKLRSVLSGGIPPLRALRADVPPALEQIVMCALQRQRAQRYANAAEMKSDLEAWLSTQAERDTRGAALRDAVGRHALTALMQARFADAMSERRAALLECFAAVDNEQRWPSSNEGDPAPLRTDTTAASPRPSVTPAEPPQRANEARKKRVGSLSLLLLLGGSVLVFGLAKQIASMREGGTPSTTEAAAAPIQVASAGLTAERPRAPEPVAPGSPSLPVAEGELAARSTREQVRAAPAAGTSQRAPAAREQTEARVFTRARTREEPANLERDSSAQPSQEAQPARGRLRLEASPYAVVSLEGRRLGITPIDVELPAAAHILTLRNPERGIETTYRVQIVAGESLLRRVELE